MSSVLTRNVVAGGVIYPAGTASTPELRELIKNPAHWSAPAEPHVYEEPQPTNPDGSLIPTPDLERLAELSDGPSDPPADPPIDGPPAETEPSVDEADPEPTPVVSDDDVDDTGS